MRLDNQVTDNESIPINIFYCLYNIDERSELAV